MYGSYGSSSSSYSSSHNSYSSYSSTSSPMDIAPTPFSSSRGTDLSCAFPSWPRRSNFYSSGFDDEEHATSYLSDEDLFPTDLEDDAHSVSSSGSMSPFQSPPVPVITEAELLELQREKAAYQREMVKLLISEKEKRKQAAKKQRRSSGGSSSGKKKSKLSAMTPIAEAE